MFPHTSINLASITFDNLNPIWFWALALAVAVTVLGLTYHTIYQRSGRRLTWFLFCLRLAGVLALFIALVKPAWTHIKSHSDRPQVAVVIDDSQSMSLLHHVAQSDQWTPRYTLAQDWLTQSDAGKSLHERFDIKLFNIAGQEIENGKLPAEPTGEQTDLVRALQAAAGRLRGQSAAGVILISDGCDTTGRTEYLSLQDYPLPIYTVSYSQPLSGQGAQFDLAVNSVDAPQRVLVHNAAPIKVLVQKDGGGAMDVPIQIERSGTPLLTQHIKFPAGSSQQMVNLSFTPTEPGDFVLAAHIPVQPGEHIEANNTKLFKLRVESEPIHVLYIEGYLRPEYTFLRARLGNDPDVNLITFVRDANPDQGSAAGAMAGGELLTAERLKKIDVVILGDFESTMFDENTYKTLRQWIEDGGSMMALGGYHTLSDDGLINTPLRDVLPVELNSSPVTQVEEPFSFHLTPEGLRHPAMTITGDLTHDQQLWDDLPPLRGITAVGAAKPAAVVLARHPRINPDDPAKLGFVVLAEQPFGKGTVAVMTADTTWRWSRLLRLAGKPDTLYVRFWSQMVRWLARRDIQDPRPALVVSTDAPSYDRGGKVTVRVKRNLAAMVPAAENQTSQLSLAVHAPDGRITPLSPAIGADPNQWTATYFPDRGGRFEVHARLIAGTPTGAGPETAPATGSKDLANQVADFLVHGSSLELDNPSTNPSAMRMIADDTGGSSTDIDDSQGLARMVESLPSKPRVSYETSKASIWNSPVLLVFFLACISAEWIVRRRHQLV